jgi:hypothetical protein
MKLQADSFFYQSKLCDFVLNRTMYAHRATAQSITEEFLLPELPGKGLNPGREIPGPRGGLFSYWAWRAHGV